MLRLENIVKEYIVGDTKVEALKGLSLSFRKNEFVSILGPSGCGKTTTLNIIGGLDKYTSGDLFINGKSTKEFKDRDWDVYRNHRIGFIFQSYNLIPHQTILGNVELALTIAGISKEERIERSKKALDEVGLSGQYYKKPNQLSGGQCQRVAIARALVNNPEILLADEPTGALDTVTSIQIMDLIKKISEDRLVIMVTHNPELAEKYSTRIVKLLDGELLSDSNPFTAEDEILEVESNKDNSEDSVVEKEKAKMSFWTAFKLSARNLHSKLKRTIMVALAGCIGIVGVSTVLAVSRGVNDYIDNMQNDMISGYPISITESGMDYAAMLNSSSVMEKAKIAKAGDYVQVDSMIEYLVDHADDIENMFISQTLTEEYIQYIKDMPKEYYQAISYGYGVDVTNNIYTSFTVTNENQNQLPAGYNNVHNYSISTIKSVYTSLLQQTQYADYASIITGLNKPISQEIDNYDYILNQYDLVAGHVPTNNNELLLVADENGAISDLVLAQLGYYTQEEFFNLIWNSTETNFDKENNPYKKIFTYDEIMNKEFYWVPNNDVFTKTGENYSYNTSKPDSSDALTLKVSGIIRQKSNVSYGSLSASMYYTTKLTEYIISNSMNSNIVQDIKAKPADKQYMTGVTGTYEFVYKGFNDSTYTKYDSSMTDDDGNPYGIMMLGTVETDYSALMTGDFSSMLASMTPKLYSRTLGGENVASEVYIYAKDFKLKNKVTSYLDKWNDENLTITLSTGEVLEPNEREQFKYQDTVGLIMNLINSMVDLVTVALVAFTALSLVVSTVMVGIITYVSVVERVKEIGVIRSLGGRKKDVSHLFNAETFIIGLSSGVIGILITAIISFLLNIVVKHYAGFNICHLTITVSIVMISLSVILTLISGIIPSRAAAKQDPVNALRTE